jgi:hypothetical protein
MPGILYKRSISLDILSIEQFNNILFTLSKHR